MDKKVMLSKYYFYFTDPKTIFVRIVTWTLVQL